MSQKMIHKVEMCNKIFWSHGEFENSLEICYVNFKLPTESKIPVTISTGIFVFDKELLVSRHPTKIFHVHETFQKFFGRRESWRRSLLRNPVEDSSGIQSRIPFEILMKVHRESCQRFLANPVVNSLEMLLRIPWESSRRYL